MDETLCEEKNLSMVLIAGVYIVVISLQAFENIFHKKPGGDMPVNKGYHFKNGQKYIVAPVGEGMYELKYRVQDVTIKTLYEFNL